MSFWVWRKKSEKISRTRKILPYILLNWGGEKTYTFVEHSEIMDFISWSGIHAIIDNVWVVVDSDNLEKITFNETVVKGFKKSSELCRTSISEAKCNIFSNNKDFDDKVIKGRNTLFDVILLFISFDIDKWGIDYEPIS